MRLANQKLNVKVSGNIVTNRFNVKLDGKMFSLLSGQLYSDPIGAVIRELSTNAADSMIGANKPNEPFLVQLPSWMEPTFRVSDDGLGLSEEDVYKIYTTYGESNKTHTDDLTGCLGLGSKSPFSYSDSFTAISRYNGKKYTYTCFVDEEQIPTIAKLSEQDTDESNGFEVIIPVDKNDINYFTTKAKEILRWFKVKPKITGQQIEFEDKPYIYKTDDYGVYRDRSWNRSGNAVMGNVGYTLDMSKVEKLDDVGRAILQHGVDLFFEVGEVQFTPNREELIYSNKTQEAIRCRLNKIAEEIKKDVKGKLESANTRWQARRVVAGFVHPVIGSICKYAINVEWNGEKINNRWDLMSIIRKSHANKDSTDGSTKTVPPDPEDTITLYTLNEEGKTCKKYLVYDITARPEIENETAVFIFDLGRGNLSRINAWLKNNNQYNAFAFENTKAAKRLLQEEGLHYTLTSTLPVAPKQARLSNNKSVQLSKLNRYVTHAVDMEPYRYWQGEDVDLEAGGVYVGISHYQCLLYEDENGELNKKLKCHPRQLAIISKAIKDLGEEIDFIYGLRPSDLKVVKNYDEEWVSLQNYMAQIYKKFKDEMTPKINLINSINSYKHHNCYIDRLVKKRKKWAFGSPLQRYTEIMEKYDSYEKDPKIKAFTDIARFQPYSSNDEDANNEFVDVWERICEDYRFLSPYTSIDLTASIECIDALDLMKGRTFPPEVKPGCALLKNEVEAA